MSTTTPGATLEQHEREYRRLKDEAARIMYDPATSYWLRHAIDGAIHRDPCDAMSDVEILHDLIRRLAASTIHD